MATINWSLQHKRDTAANWTANNPTLLAGQIGIETDNLTTTPKFKIGDGSTAWNALPYFYGGALSAQNLSNVLSVGNTTGNNDIIQTGTSVLRNNDSSCFLDLATSGFLELYSTDGLYKYYVDSDATSQYVEMKTEDVATQTELSYFQSIPLQTNIGVFSAATGNRLTQLEVTNGEIKTNIVNNLTFAGIKYNADFSANYTNRSLVDKGYVDGQLSSYLTTANAALTYQPLDSDLTSWAGVTRASGFDTFATTPSSANLSSLLTDKTGTGVNVFGTSPTFTTDITTPLIIGGSAVGSTIQYKGTSGNGTSTVAAHQFLVGNNGATTAAQIFNSGQVSIGNYASPTNLRLVTIGQDTAYMSFGSLVGGTSECAVYMNAATPSATNFILNSNGVDAQLNAPSISSSGSVFLRIQGSTRYTVTNSTHAFVAAATTSGTTTNFTFTASANTGQTASTEITNFKVNGASKTWSSGNITTQRWNYFTANTAAFASASTISESIALAVEAATAGTNATITNNFALGLTAGTATVKIGNLTGTTDSSAIYLNQATPSSSNYIIRSDSSGNSFFNGAVNGGNVTFQAFGTTWMIGNSNRIRFTPAASTAGAVNTFTFTNPASTGQTASTEINGLIYNGGSRQWLSGAITTQRELYCSSTTYSFTSPSTITNAYGAYFEAPTAGSNCTITNNYALGANGSFLFSDGTRSLAYTLAANSILNNTGDTSSQIKTTSGTRSINIQSYAGDVNYIDAANNTLRIRTTTNNAIELWTNSSSRLGINTASLTFSDSFNITFNSTNGTKIGTATSEKLAFWNATPIVQPTTAVAAATFVANAGTAVNDASTFDGYTLKQVVKALRNIGLLA